MALSDAELVKRMREGKEEAYAELFHRRRDDVFRFAFHMTGSREAAEDITQEVFLFFIQQDGFDANRGTLSAYLFGIAKNFVNRWLEKNRVISFPIILPEMETKEDPLGKLVRQKRLEDLRKRILALPDPYREVVVLCELDELTYEQAAMAIGCAVGTVRSRLHRARALLAKKLGAEFEEESSNQQQGGETHELFTI